MIAQTLLISISISMILISIILIPHTELIVKPVQSQNEKELAEFKDNHAEHRSQKEFHARMGIEWITFDFKIMKKNGPPATGYVCVLPTNEDYTLELKDAPVGHTIWIMVPTKGRVRLLHEGKYSSWAFNNRQFKLSSSSGWETF